MPKVVSKTVDLSVDALISCKYPRHGNGNILKNRQGVIRETGSGPAGDYVKVELTDGSFRNFSVSRMIDPVNA